MSQRLKDRIEQIIAEKFAVTLLDHAIDQHMRHGFKTDCECQACLSKRVKTWNYYCFGPETMHYLEKGY